MDVCSRCPKRCECGGIQSFDVGERPNPVKLRPRVLQTIQYETNEKRDENICFFLYNFMFKFYDC